jgi:hypothetical protein
MNSSNKSAALSRQTEIIAQLMSWEKFNALNPDYLMGRIAASMQETNSSQELRYAASEANMPVLT